MKIAIIGYGSIGKRHAKNCETLGYDVDVYSKHANRKLGQSKYGLVVVASRTSDHLKNVKQFKDFSDNFFIEKPLASNYKDGLAIKKLLVGKKVRVGYCLIFNPIIAKVKNIVDEKKLGNIYFAQIYAGSYLPGWRKGEDYKEVLDKHTNIQTIQMIRTLPTSYKPYEHLSTALLYHLYKVRIVCMFRNICMLV